MNLQSKAEFFLLPLKNNSNLITSSLFHSMILPWTGMASYLHLLPLLTTVQFLVDDALHMLSSLSHSHARSDTTSSSMFLRLLAKFIDFTKSLSFLQYSSQEEQQSSSTDPKTQSLQKAVKLLTKAARADNTDAMYLLGELNFVPPPNTSHPT